MRHRCRAWIAPAALLACWLLPPVAFVQDLPAQHALPYQRSPSSRSAASLWMQDVRVGLIGRAAPSHVLALPALLERARGRLSGALAQRWYGADLLPSLSAQLSAAYGTRQLQLRVDVEYAHSLVPQDHAAHMRLAALKRWRGALITGLESRLTTDLERDGDEPLGEPELDGALGPLLAVDFGSVALVATGAVRSLRTRQAAAVAWGAACGLSLSGAL